MANMNSENEARVSDFPARIGRPATNALAHVGLSRLDQLTAYTEAELLKMHGVGPKAVSILRDELAAKGLSFAAVSQTKSP